MERRREQRVPARRALVPREIDDLDGGQRARRRALRQREPRQLGALREAVRLDARRRAAEHAHGPRAVRAQEREVARVITKALLLLERRVVLLVDHDHAEPLHRREDRRARADRERHLPAAERPPSVVALALLQPAVQHREVVPEARAKAPDELRRERDLRHEQDRPASLFAGLGDRAQVDLRLPRARHAVQQKAVIAARVHRADERVHRRLLRGVRHRRDVALDGHGEVAIRDDLALLCRDEPALDERAQHRARLLEVLPKLRERHLAALLEQRQERPLPLPEARVPDRLRRAPGDQLGARAERRAGQRLVLFEKAVLPQPRERLARQRGGRRAQHLAHRMQVVVRRLDEQREQFRREHGLRVHDPRDAPHAPAARRRLGAPEHDPRQFAGPERHGDAHSRRDLRHQRGRHSVREAAPDRHRHRDLDEVRVRVERLDLALGSPRRRRARRLRSRRARVEQRRQRRLYRRLRQRGSPASRPSDASRSFHAACSTAATAS